MRRAFLSLAFSVLFASVSSAQLDSPLKLVRGLRDAGLTDLALDRLKELQALKGALSPEELKTLPLDVASIRLEQALQEVEDGKRLSLTTQAQGEFQAFITANPAHPRTAEANIKIAQLIAVNAKGLLSKGRRIEEKEKRAAEFSKVRPEFDKAVARYQGAITAMEARLKPLDPKDPAAIEMKDSLLQAMLDSAVLVYEKAKTFIGEGEGGKQSEEILKAQKAFGVLANKYSNERAGYLAAVWQLQCDFEIVDPAKAATAMVAFINANRANREASDAVRQAQYFVIEHIDRGDTKNPVFQKQLVENAANEWLKKYPEHRNSREGLRVRFLYLGLAKQDRAKPGIKYDAKTGHATSVTPEARALLESANKVYAELADTENEYSDRAAVYRLKNVVALLDAAGAGKDTPITAIRTLEQGYLAAQVQQARILQLRDKPESTGAPISLEDPKTPKGKEPPPKGKEPPKAKEAPKAKEPEEEMPEEEDDPKKPKPKTESQKRVDLAIAYLERGLSMATPKDSVRDVMSAQLLLALFFKEANRSVEAAVLCEGVARNNPKMSKGALAAQIGVDSYNVAYERLKGSVNKTDEALAADIARIKALAEFADKTWPNEPPTDGVRQALAYHLNKEKNYEGAWNTLSRVTNAYPNISQVRWSQGIALFFMVNPETRDSKLYRDELQKNITTRAAQWTQTISQLETLPEPAPATEPQRGTAYLLARTMLSQLYYMASDYAKAEATAKAAAATAVKLTSLEAGQKADLIADARVQYFKSVSGRAAEFIRAKEFAKVAEVLDAEITALTKELKDAPPNASPAAERLRKAQLSLVVSAMTAAVQDKKVDRASELLGVLQSGGGSIESNITVMQSLVGSIRGQIEGLKKENKEAEAKELTDSFTQFLDKIAGDPTKLPNSLVLFLGDGYDSVGESVKAFNLYDQVIKKPYTNPGKTEEEKAAAEAANTVFVRRLQFEQVRALRQAGGENNLKSAMSLMRGMIGDPIAVKPPPKQWGYNNVNMRKEYIFILEDQGQFGAAIKNWEKLSKEFVPSVPVPGKPGDKDGEAKAKKRQLFFDLNYEVQRASARAWATLPKDKWPKGYTQETVDGKLADIGQKLFNLTDSNKDINGELQDKIKDLVAKYPQVKKKFDDLAALGAKKDPAP